MNANQGKFRFALAAAIVGLCSTTVFAQSEGSGEMTVESLAAAFSNQKTRGLVIVPSAGSTQAAETETGTTQVAAASQYQELAKEDQINIQISFDFDSASLRADQTPILSTMCEAMKSVDVAMFQIIGHTDSSGSASYNENLSLLRAQEVKRHLVDNCGIEASRLQAIGMGESAPFNSANPRADENRRVEFQALG